MKRKFLIVISLILSLVILGACGNKSDSGANTNETLIVGYASDLKTLDPANAYEIFGNMYFYATYENLMMFEGSDISKVVPALAKEYSLDETGLVYTFTLNDDHKFASGNKVTSADVAFSINRTKNLKGNVAYMTDGIESVTTPDDVTVIITLKERDSAFLMKLASNSFCVLDSKLIKENGGTDSDDADKSDKAGEYLDKNSAGSGPYVLDSWSVNTELVLTKNPHYHGTVGINKVIFKEIPDANTATQMLEKGDVDIVLSIGNEQAKQLTKNSDINVVSTPTMTLSFLMMNCDKEIGKELSDPKVQQAVRYALDYKGLSELAGDGTLLPLSFVQDGFVGSKLKDTNYRNLDKAKALLKEAGYENGFSTTLTAANYDSEGLEWPVIAQKVKADLAEIGIDVKIETGEVGVVIDNYRNGKSPFLVMHWAPDYMDLNNQLAFLPGDIVGKRANWSEESNQQLIELGKNIISELDETNRAKLSGQLQEALAEDSPYAFLVQHPKPFAYSNNLKNVVFSNYFKVELKNIKFAK